MPVVAPLGFAEPIRRIRPNYNKNTRKDKNRIERGAGTANRVACPRKLREYGEHLALSTSGGGALHTLLILLLGLGVGLLVGLMGIGGGIVLVPAFVYLLGMDQHLAQGTSLLILLPPIGLGALREYWKQDQVDLHAGILCALGILLGAYGGSLIALPMPSRHLKGAFGCFLMLAAFLLWRKARLEGRAVGRVEEIARG